MSRIMLLALLTLGLAQPGFAQGQLLPAPAGPSINTALQGVTPRAVQFLCGCARPANRAA